MAHLLTGRLKMIEISKQVCKFNAAKIPARLIFTNMDFKTCLKYEYTNLAQTIFALTNKNNIKRIMLLNVRNYVGHISVFL